MGYGILDNNVENCYFGEVFYRWINANLASRVEKLVPEVMIFTKLDVLDQVNFELILVFDRFFTFASGLLLPFFLLVVSALKLVFSIEICGRVIILNRLINCW